MGKIPDSHTGTIAKLKFNGSRGAPMSFDLQSEVTIGRSRDCDIVLDDVGISRHHAEIRPGSDGWTVRDLGSTNGVLVNGQPALEAQPLQPGDRVELGSTEIVFEVG